MEAQKEFKKLHTQIAKILAMLGKVDKQFERVDKQFEVVNQRFDNIEANFATKADLNAQTKDLKEFAVGQTETLAQIIHESIDEPLSQHLKDVSLDEDLSMRVLHLEKDVRQIKKSLAT